MSTTFVQNDRNKFKPAREHDYIFDSLFVVSGEKDHDKAARKAAIASAQKTVVPVFETMFSDLQTHANAYTVYHTNCRLPQHMRITYSHKTREKQTECEKHIKVMGKDRFRYFATPKTIVPMPTVPLSQELNQQTVATHQLISSANLKEKNDKIVQTMYRESSAQTLPYQTEYKIADGCKEIPEVLHLDNMEINIEDTTDVKCVVKQSIVDAVTRGRVRRAWLEDSSFAMNPMILHQLAAADQLFREKQVEKILLKKFELEVPPVLRGSRIAAASDEASRVWTEASNRLHKTLNAIQQKKEREMRKLEVRHSQQAHELKKGNNFVRDLLHIRVNPEFLPKEDELRFTKNSIDLKTIWRDNEDRCKKRAVLDDKCLIEMHSFFKGARELRSPVEINLKSYSLPEKPARRLTSVNLNKVNIDTINQDIDTGNQDENSGKMFEAVLLLQRVLRGRAVQTKIYEDLSRKCELIHELVKSDCHDDKSSVDLLDQEKLPPAYEKLKNVTAGRVLFLLNKELDLQIEQEHCQDILRAAENERYKREAAEAGRRQIEERRSREHNEMFSQIMEVTEQSIERTLKKIISVTVVNEANLSAKKEVEELADILQERDWQLEYRDNELESAEFIAELILSAVLPQTENYVSEDPDKNQT